MCPFDALKACFYVKQAYMGRRIKVAQDMWQLMGVKREDKVQRAKAMMENFRFWGAPVGIIVTVDRVSDVVWVCVELRFVLKRNLLVVLCIISML